MESELALSKQAKADKSEIQSNAMEQMAGLGKIDRAQYRLINLVTTDSSCQSSTKIYPNWTLATTEQARAALTEQVKQYLFALQQIVSKIERAVVIIKNIGHWAG